MQVSKKILISIILGTAVTLIQIQNCFGLAISFYYGTINNIDLYLIGDCHIDEYAPEIANIQYAIIKQILQHAHNNNHHISFLVESSGHPDQPYEDNIDEISKYIWPILNTVSLCKDHQGTFACPDVYESSKKEFYSSLIYQCSQIPNAQLLDKFPAICDFLMELADNNLGNFYYEMIYQHQNHLPLFTPQTYNLNQAITYTQKIIAVLSDLSQDESVDSSSTNPLHLAHFLQKKALRCQQNILQPLKALRQSLKGTTFINVLVNEINLKMAYQASCFICNLEDQLSKSYLYNQCQTIGNNIALRRHKGGILEAEVLQHIAQLRNNTQTSAVFLFAGASHCENLISTFLPAYGFELLYAAGDTSFKSLVINHSKPSLIIKENKIIQTLLQLIKYRFKNPEYEPLTYSITNLTI